MLWIFLGLLFVMLDVQFKIFVIMWTSFLDIHLCLFVLSCTASLIITSSSYIMIWKKEIHIDVWIPKFIKWNGLFSSEMKNGGICATFYIYMLCHKNFNTKNYSKQPGQWSLTKHVCFSSKCYWIFYSSIMHNSSCNYSVAVSPNFIIRITVPKPVSLCEYSFCSLG